MHQNNIFLFHLKIIFDINALKWFENTKNILIWSKQKNKRISNFFKKTFETQKQTDHDIILFLLNYYILSHIIILLSHTLSYTSNQSSNHLPIPNQVPKQKLFCIKSLKYQTLFNSVPLSTFVNTFLSQFPCII
jgi:hypothetical protein